MISASSSVDTLETEPGSSARPRDVAPSGGRVLVAEDDAALRELLAELLTNAGHKVVSVPNGAQALIALQNPDAFDVVLTDLMMPGVGGEGVLAGARDRAPNVPVIVMTAFGGTEVEERVRRFGAAAYFDKPFRLENLVAAIRLIGRRAG